MVNVAVVEAVEVVEVEVMLQVAEGEVEPDVRLEGEVVVDNMRLWRWRWWM